ncbi:hypothetical protein [Bdellovibrio sp. HCB274]|uniref:hypothetical protein n=1 Tax=Bdellovibrio sp. HCB274 TaxID=3394361 RepID=UPI0039B6E15E
MMVTCPRCGFQQPKDKYCAQCGVDMESFKPQAQPWHKTFFKNPVLHVAVFVAIIGAGGFYIYKNKQANQSDVASTSRPSVRVNSSNNLPPPPPPAPETNLEVAGSMNEVPAAAFAAANSGDADVSKELAAARGLSAEATATPDESKKATTTKNVSGPHLTVYYAEVNRQALSRLVEASRSSGQFIAFNDYSAGIVPGLEKRMQIAGIKILHKEERPVESGKTLQWTYGIKNRSTPGVEIGLTTFFELSDIDGNNLRGNLEIQRTWREPSASGGFEIQRKSFPAIFEIGGETGFLMAGVMPAQSNLENDDELTALDVYKILRSSQFRAGESEFVIFVEYDSK